MNSTWINTKEVLKPETLRMLAAKLSQQGIKIVDGWTASNPAQVKEWEASGELLDQAMKAQDQASESLAEAKAQGMTHLADHEIFEMYGPNLRL